MCGKDVYRVSQKKRSFVFEGLNLGWEAPIRPSRGSFELLWFSAFTWTQKVMDSVKASLRKLHLKRANLTQN